MVIKVGINGFGRIGRIVSRACLQNSEFELSAINDPAITVDYVCYLIKFDSTHGKMTGNITHTDDGIHVNGHQIKVFHEKLPPSVPWASAGVQYVVEASGMFTTHEKAAGHLKCDGVKLVIVTAPSSDIPMIILGVNDHTLRPESKVISCASSTLYCLAPIVKVLEDCYGVEEGFVTSIHAMTPSLKPLDGLCLKGRHWRDHRSIHQNIIPASTGACKALGKIFPQVKDKLSGIAFRVPIVNVSVLDLTVRLQTSTTLQEIVKSVEQASRSTLKNIIKVSNEESVSSDFIGEKHSCILDVDSSIQQKPNFFKIICWYENEFSYACRVVDTINYFEKRMFTGVPTEINCLRKISCGRCQNVGKQTKWCSKRYLATGKLAISSEIMSSVSQDTGVKIRSSPHPLFIKKPLSATTPSPQIHKDTTRNEVLRIWNDPCENSKSNATQSKCSLFQACKQIGFQAQPMMVEQKTQERLENVKREFSKMVNLSEDLLKKTHSNQSDARISIEKTEHIIGTIIKGKTDFFKGDAESITHLGGRSLFDASNNNEKLKICSKTESSVSCDKKISHCSECVVTNDDSKTFIDFSEPGQRKSNRNDINRDRFIEFDIESSNKQAVKPNKKEFEQHVSKTVNTYSDRFSQNVQVQCVWNNNDIKIPTEKETTDDLCKNTNIRYFEADCKNISYEKCSITPIVYKNNTTISDKSNIKHIDKILRKRNIVLVDKSFLTETESHLFFDENEKTIDEIEKQFIEMPLSEKPPEMLTIVSEEPTKYETPENTIISTRNIDYENTLDIYDKLDSVSGSNSDNSFKISEKKSKVLQITDLTNSLEDLARLDKICRIIEISDEMSDKLFSALDDDDEGVLNKKIWSFKDLCARIKLDDFCDKIFGGTA